MYVNDTTESDLLTSVPVILLISSASAVLAVALCGLFVCQCCAILYVLHTQALAEQVVQPTTTPSGTDPCYTCFDTASDTVLTPCGHRGLCSACAARLWSVDRRCPLCRRVVGGVVLIGGV